MNNLDELDWYVRSYLSPPAYEYPPTPRERKHDREQADAVRRALEAYANNEPVPQEKDAETGELVDAILARVQAAKVDPRRFL